MVGTSRNQWVDPDTGWEFLPASDPRVIEQRDPWVDGETIRGLGESIVSAVGERVSVSVEHREFEGFAFVLEVDPVGALWSIEVRPLVFAVAWFGGPGGPLTIVAPVHRPGVPEGDAPEWFVPLGPTLLKHVPWGDLHRWVLRHADVEVVSSGGSARPSWPDATDRRLGRRPTISAHELAAFCADWVRWIDQGVPNPRQLMSRQWCLSDKGVEYRTTKGRKLGLLRKPAKARGRALDTLTERGRDAALIADRAGVSSPVPFDEVLAEYLGHGVSGDRGRVIE